MIPHDIHLQIGSLLFEGIDQIDLTGPVRSAVAYSEFDLSHLRQDRRPCARPQGLAADAGCRAIRRAATRRAAYSGGFGQEALMEDEEVLGWITQQVAGARSVFSVCTGALICGAAGLLKGRRATTHWASFHLLPLFGAIPVNERIVLDGNWVFAAGVTAGIDGALRLAAELRGDDAARAIQLYMVYAPEPPFDSGTPETAPVAILEQARQSVAGITAQREATAQRAAVRLGIPASAFAANDAKNALAGSEGYLALSPKRPALCCRQWAQSLESNMTTMTLTKTAAPQWLLAMWKEIDDKTFGKGMDCFAEMQSAISASLTGTAAKRSATICASSSTRALPPATTSWSIGTADAQDLPWQGRDEVRRSRHRAGAADDVSLLLHGRERSDQGQALDRRGRPDRVLGEPRLIRPSLTRSGNEPSLPEARH